MSNCYVSAMTPPVVSEEFTYPTMTFFKKCTLHVPKGTKNQYAAAEGWMLFEKIVDDASTTAIQEVTDVNDQPSTDTWYTLDGRRLNAQPSKPGLYIHNGKKLVIK